MIILHDIMIHPLVWKRGLHYQTLKLSVNQHHLDGKWLLSSSFAVYAISSISRSILNPFIGQWPILGNAIIYTAILVVLLTYFALPIANRLLRSWLYPGNV